MTNARTDVTQFVQEVFARLNATPAGVQTYNIIISQLLADASQQANTLIGQPGRHLLISGGELTVTAASKHGCGGPNLEYLAGALTGLAPDDPIAVLACDSDGIDGTEDNAGGFALAGAALPEALAKALAVHRTYALFDALGCLIKTGPTRTNVNDIRMIAVNGLDRCR